MRCGGIHLLRLRCSRPSNPRNPWISHFYWLFMKTYRDFYDIPISRHSRPSRFFMTIGPILRVRSSEALVPARLGHVVPYER